MQFADKSKYVLPHFQGRRRLQIKNGQHSRKFFIPKNKESYSK